MYLETYHETCLNVAGKSAMNKHGINGLTVETLLTRREVAARWKVSIETVKRRERARILRPMRLDGRIIRYRMSDVVQIEQEGYAV
jgi:hypothetical protein